MNEQLETETWLTYQCNTTKRETCSTCLTLGVPVTRTHSLDEMRLIDYSEDNGVVGVEFIDASQGSGLERRSLLQHR